MNDTVKKIQVQIDYHMAEARRLQTALDVIAEFEGKPAAKELPMFTVQKIGGGKPATVDGSASLTEQIKAILSDGKARKASEITALLDFGNRAKKSAANPLSSLKSRGEIVAVSGGKYALADSKPAGKKKASKDKLPEGGVGLRKQIMATLEAFPNQALSRADMLGLINMGDRAPSTFDSMLAYLKKTEVVVMDANGGYTLPKPEAASAVEVQSDADSKAA